MKEEYEQNLKAIYVRTRETDDIFVYKGVATVDEIQPNRKKKREVERGAFGRLSSKKIFKQGTTLALLLLAFTFATGITASHQTISYFNDLENASGNNLNAGLLDFTVNAKNYSGDVTVGETGVMFDPAASGEPGSLQLEYKVAAEKKSGPDTFCNALVANFAGGVVYDGPLLALAIGPTSAGGAYDLSLTMPDATGVVNGDTCVVDLVYTGWYQNAPDGQGYVDEERVTLTLKANIPELLIQPFSAPSFDFFSLPEGDTPPPEEKILEETPPVDEGGTPPGEEVIPPPEEPPAEIPPPEEIPEVIPPPDDVPQQEVPPPPAE